MMMMMRSLFIVFGVLVLSIGANAQDKKAEPAANTASEVRSNESADHPTSENDPSIVKPDSPKVDVVDKASTPRKRAEPMVRSAEMLERKKIEPKLTDPQ